MSLYSKDVTTTNLWVKSISQASDEFMISYPGQYVDALFNFRLDGELSVASSVPVNSSARNTLSVRLSIYSADGSITYYQSTKGISLVNSNSVPNVPNGFRELYDDFGVPVNLDSGYYWATFLDVPLNFSLYGLPTNTPLEYELQLMNDIIRNGIADFDNTLRFDAVTPIVLEGADGIYTLTSTTGSFGLGESSGEGYQIIIGQPIPEPSTMLLLGFGLAGVGLFRRRFKN